MMEVMMEMVMLPGCSVVSVHFLPCVVEVAVLLLPLLADTGSEERVEREPDGDRE